MENNSMTRQHPRSTIRRRVLWLAILILAAAVVIAIVWTRPQPQPQPQQTMGSIPPYMTSSMTYEVVNTYPHDPTAFTQGLIYHEGYLYESTGLYGESSLRKVTLETGQVLQRVDLPANTFGEGLALWEDRLIQLTWQEGTGFVYALADFSPLGQFTYPTEGWGLTQDGSQLIMSDGSHRLFFMDTESFQIVGEVEVYDQGQPVERLNELEYINGEVYANIWLTDEILRIDPNSGEVTGRIELQGILPENLITPTTDVLNGIAYDPEDNRLFVTGKNWPLLFEIRLVPLNGAQ